MLDGGNNVVCEKDQDSKKMMDACQISGEYCLMKMTLTQHAHFLLQY